MRGLGHVASEPEINEESMAAEESTTIDDDLVPTAIFLFPDKAMLVRELLPSVGLLRCIENEYMVRMVWPWSYALGGLLLMVPASLVDHVREILNETASEVELAAQAGTEMESGSIEAGKTSMTQDVGRAGKRVRMLLAITNLSSPALNSLRLSTGYAAEARITNLDLVS